MQPEDLHQRVESAFNGGDVDALIALYEPDARMVDEDGGVAIGIDAPLSVHLTDGKIQEQDSYGNDPRDVPG